MNGQQNNQTEQNTNMNQSQSSENRNQNSGGLPGFMGLFFPLNLFGERQREQQTSPPNNDQTQSLPQSSPVENNSQQNGFPQFLQFFIYPGTQEGDDQTPPGVFFFTPFFMQQQEVRKPRASESAINSLPIVTITKENVDSQTSCPICLENFSLSTGQEEQHVRQMPCNHMFCESCLFQWLRQNNSCPLCRKEIEAEAEQQNNNGTTNVPLNVNVPLFGINVANSPSTPAPPTSSPTITTHSSSCALGNVGCCEEIDNETTTSPTPIITLPQCHHRFHASCLRTSLLVEGYSPGDFNSISQPLNFHCPTCRAPAIVQSDMLKMPTTALHDEHQEGQQVIPFNLPITIRIPDFDDMDLD